MRIAYLDCFSGISGDMFLGALLDAGVSFELLRKTVADLNVGATLEMSRVDRGGISAVKLDVIVDGEKDMPREEYWARKGAEEQGLGVREEHTHPDEADCLVGGTAGPSASLRSGRDDKEQLSVVGGQLSVEAERPSRYDTAGPSTRAEALGRDDKEQLSVVGGRLSEVGDQGSGVKDQQGVGHSHEHSHSHSNANGHSHSHAPTRGLSEILKIIAGAPIGERARQTASEIFMALGAAEAKVHNVGIEEIHFHEVGAADAIVDIVCAAVGAQALGVEQFVCSPLNVGSGTVTCVHGVMPVPAPATLELLQGVPIYSGEIQKELVTPTGAAIVKVIVSSFGPRPAMSAEKIGYGAGTRNFPGHANVLRISIGESEEKTTQANDSASHVTEEEIAILEANLDDLNPQLIGYIAEKALAEGALDVFTTPVQMKKNRPGTLLTMLARPGDEERLRGLLFRESSTLGVRTRHEKRYALARRHETVATPWGEVRMKVASMNGAVSQYAPEYEDCRRIAAEHHVPLKTVMQEAIRLYLDRQNG